MASSSKAAASGARARRGAHSARGGKRKRPVAKAEAEQSATEATLAGTCAELAGPPHETPPVDGAAECAPTNSPPRNVQEPLSEKDSSGGALWQVGPEAPVTLVFWEAGEGDPQASAVATVVNSQEEAWLPPHEEFALGAEAASADSGSGAWAAPPPLSPISPPVVAISQPRSIAYLSHARRAAQAHGEALDRSVRPGLLTRLRDDARLAFGASAGAAALCLTVLALLAARASGSAEHEQPVAIAEADAATISPSTPADPEALLQVYRDGQDRIAAGRESDGLRLLRSAAEGGLPLAQYALSKHYEAGDGVPRDLARARAWAQRAAEGGHIRAMHDVGVYFARGEGGAQNDAAAFRWFRDAATFGVADSQFNLGVLYEQGRGTAVDPSAALYWFLVAARNHDAEAVDRAVAVAATLPVEEVARVRDESRTFRARTPATLGDPIDMTAGLP